MKKILGLHVINKPLGISSQKAVQIIKWWAWRNSGDKKIKVGHGGTLDPLASGVLVVAVGKEHTKKISTVVGAEKEYVAEITLGQMSTTDDAEGEKTIFSDCKKPLENEVKEVVKKFIGNISQVPPQFSAIKINGQEAYKRVRRGENPSMKSRLVCIKNITVLSYHYPKIRIRVTCGKGTYIRSLARDIGTALGTGGFLSSLERTRVGECNIENANDIDDYRFTVVVHGAELDQERIDGTRVYMKELLDHMGKMASDDQFTIYHKGSFNKSLTPPHLSNYKIKELGSVPLWTQTRFAWQIFTDKPDVVWLPFHNIPLIRSRSTKFVATIHDLAFNIYPETFPKKDLRRLRFHTRRTVTHADHLIAVSQSTKNDLLAQYPYHLDPNDITVIHHGVDIGFWQKKDQEHRMQQILNLYGLKPCQYIIHVGALQPRKNLVRLIKSFEDVNSRYPDLKLVLVGGRGWLWEEIEKHARESVCAKNIIFTGNIPFVHVRTLVQNATIFALPSLYEGFGLPGLEALAAGTVVAAAKNSSLPEILGDSAIYFDPHEIDSITETLQYLLQNEHMRDQLIIKGLSRVKKFTWEKSTRETLRVLRSASFCQ
jgi:tRNA pseudouridine55 synthase